MTKINPLIGLSCNVQRIRDNTNYKPVLSIINGLIPQSTMTELATSLMDIYRINKVGGAGSRKRVNEILLRLGIQPNG